MNKRQEAMIWWNHLTLKVKNEICQNNPKLIGDGRKWESLTGREIELLYNKLF